MAGISQIIILLLQILFLIDKSICTIVKDETVKDEAADLEAAEANGKLEIIKQIKKVNEDGSYTIGYEADDGSFKIESRDVLGNIKGTYGYIDDRGDIKRVSYSTSNSSEIVTSTNEPPSVVQRIPAKLNRTLLSSPTTRRPYSSTTESSPTTTTVIQAIPRRRIIASSTPTPTTTYVLPQSSTTRSSTILYETSTPARILAQSKPLVRSTTSTQTPTQKSEGQLLRPEVTLKPTDMPLYRRLPIKTTLLDEVTKPVTEEPEVRGNLLRRQLPQDKIHFDPRQHVVNAQQGAGDDAADVYNSASVTTGSPRPLFTTVRPRLLPTTASPVIHRPTPTLRYAYQRPSTTRAPTTTQYAQESSSTEPSITPSPVPVVQIPPNNEGEPQRQQFVELRHPFHRGAILVPVNHLQGRRIPEEAQQQYEQPPPENLYVRRPKFRPIPVHVDEHGYIREVPQREIEPQISTPYPQEARQYVSQADIINEVDQIKPPVSTRDFQRLLEQLILRQSRLEKISTLTRENYQRAPRVYPQPQPVYHHPQQGPIQFVPRPQHHPQHQHIPQHHPQYPPPQYGPVTYTPPPLPYHPTKRMAPVQSQEQDDEFLPAPVREMLLLRMLQLAINPSLPLEVSDNLESATTPLPRKDAVRNVEILGEEDEPKRPSRTKRYKEYELDYYD